MDILGIPSENASDAACHLEHLIDEDTAARFVLFSEAIEKRCDAASLRTFLSEAIELMEQNKAGNCRTLDTLQHGEIASVVKISSNITEPDKLDIKTGDKVILENRPLDRTHLHLSVNGKPLEIALNTAENIFIN